MLDYVYVKNDLKESVNCYVLEIFFLDYFLIYIFFEIFCEENSCRFIIYIIIV